MRLVKLLINNSRIQDSIETACLQVTSPTGKTIWIYKKYLSRFSDAERTVFWKFCNDPMVRFIGEMDASIEEMKVLKKLSNAVGKP